MNMKLLTTNEYSETLKKEKKKSRMIAIIGTAIVFSILFAIIFPAIYLTPFENPFFNNIAVKILMTAVGISLVMYLIFISADIIVLLVAPIFAILHLISKGKYPDIESKDNVVSKFFQDKSEEDIRSLFLKWSEYLRYQRVRTEDLKEELSEKDISEEDKKAEISERLGETVWPVRKSAEERIDLLHDYAAQLDIISSKFEKGEPLEIKEIYTLDKFIRKIEKINITDYMQ